MFGPKVFRKYESIRDVIGVIGFVPTDNPFRFSRKVKGELTVELDFLSEEEALRAIPRGFVRVQEDLSAVIIPGSSVALRSNFEAEVTGTLPDAQSFPAR